MFTVFGTYKNSDMTEGKGPMVLDKVFFEEADANSYILEQSGVMGRKPEHGLGWQRMGDWEVKPIVVLESLADGEEYVRSRNLERAFSKLTESEQEALEAHYRASLT